MKIAVKFFLWIVMATVICSPAGARIVYVDTDARGTNSGGSWTDAHMSLQDALTMASTGDEIRVAEGVYRPNMLVLIKRPTRGRSETFELKSGVAVRGGYAGFGAPDPNARDIRARETVLTGDLLGNDPPRLPEGWEDIRSYLEHPDRNDNCYSVVTADGVDSTAVLDGCTITAGHANIFGQYGPWEPEPNLPDAYHPQNTGAGLYNNAGSPTITACTFRHNSTISYRADTGGAAIFNIDSTPTITDCNFVENWTFTGDASCAGGAIRNINSDTTLTACVFTRNSAQGFDSEYYGGAVFNTGGHLTVTDCTFTANRTDWGGAIDNSGGSLTLTGCNFSDNTVDDSGGAVFNYGPLSMTDCTFTNNEAYSAGGAVLAGSTEQGLITACTFVANHGREGGAIYTGFRVPLTVEKCTFSANSAMSGGAIASSGAWYHDPNGYTSVADCVFSANRADTGGAIETGWHKIVSLSNCLLAGNSATHWGGGISASGSTLSVTNCTLTANRAPQGDAMAGRWEPSDVQISNCILFNGGEEISDTVGSTITINHTDIRGGWTGAGNIDTDPLFANPGHWDPNGTPQDPNDDFWIDGDYHLKSQAGRWDPDNDTWVQDNITSPCIDAGDPMTPIGHEPFPNGGIVNVGAYGGTPEASKSYFNAPTCKTIVAGDINGDCRVDFKDFAIMSLHWLQQH